MATALRSEQARVATPAQTGAPVALIAVQRRAREKNALLTEWAAAQRAYISRLQYRGRGRELLQEYTLGIYNTATYSVAAKKTTVRVDDRNSQSVIKLIDVIKKAPALPISCKLFRGISNVQPQNGIYVQPYLASVSFSRKVATNFVGAAASVAPTADAATPACCMYILNIPAGSRCVLLGRRNIYETVNSEDREINPLYFDNQYEVLLPPFRGKVTKTIVRNGITNYYIDEIVFRNLSYDSADNAFMFRN